MTAILYPVAETAEAALHAPRGYAEREREAQSLAADTVVFVSEAVGPAFPTREAALSAYAGRLAGEGADGPAAPESRWRQLVPVSAQTESRLPAMVPAQPSYRDGRRWPIPEEAPAILWRLSVSYWKIAGAQSAQTSDPARKVRRGEAGRGLSGPALNALARQPLRAVRLQQPLDIGLFEVRPPEAPDTLIPDE
ncbi:hypothetical protein [Caulobacter sp. S45]|uniref:hypothetical protein n=1 Tax=Caulobacter sp. S45 TaxID=1641861 RepID=UPI001576E39F|nr:hypothetical protein [Caulobacter sp. S45]